MTGIFRVVVNGKEKRKRVEIMQEIGDWLWEWWETANIGDEFKIICELPV